MPVEQSPMRGYPRNRLIGNPGVGQVIRFTTRSRGHTISYEDAGTGTAILVLPGWTMSAADWRDAGYVAEFASSYRVLAIDPLGNGLSDKPHDPDAYRWPALAADVIGVMDAAGLERAVVWGYSRGSALAAAVAAEFPDRVAALILLAGGDLTEDVPAGGPVDPLDEAMFGGDFGPLWDMFSFSAVDRRYDAEVNDPRALGAMGIAEARFGRVIDLGRITAPALVYVGGDDSPSGDKKTADALGVDVIVLPDLDHLTVFTRTDLVFPMVRGFLESHGL
jgi:pimeloyl-ACP methyl ester carboxylesterase